MCAIIAGVPKLIALGNGSKTYYCEPTQIVQKELEKTLITGNANNLHVYELTDGRLANTINKSEPACEGSSTTLDTLLQHFLAQKAQIDGIHVKLDRLLQAKGLLGAEETNQILNFPLQTLEDILELEAHLRDDNYKQHLERILHLVGGSDSPKLIRRCLARIFSDKLATQCSFTGAKENFRVKDLILMQELNKVVRQNFPETSDFEFEKVVKDFFRYAGQRMRMSSVEVSKLKRKRAGNVYGTQ